MISGFTIDKTYGYELEIKGSKFLSFLIPIKEFDCQLFSLIEKHKKAVHFVTAKRWINEFEQIVESSSDDGEPKGSSGIPSLNVLRGEKIIDCGVVVVRYFGGTLLGVGGLVRAYSDAVLGVVRSAELLSHKKIEKISLKVGYENLDRAEYIAKKHSLILEKEAFLTESAEVVISGAKSDIEGFLSEYRGTIDYKI